MRRWPALFVPLSLVIVLLSWAAEVSARNAGGDFRSGSRATRGDGAGSGSSSDQSPGGDWSAPDSSAPKKAPKPPSLYGTIRNLVFGGLIGSLFFGQRFGGFGLLEVVILSSLVLVAFRALSRYQPEAVGQYAGAGGYGPPVPALEEAAEASPSGSEAPAAIERGIESIRQTDSTFDAAGFARTVDSTFRAVQAALTARDVARAADVLTVEMRERLQKESDRLRSLGRINRVERISIERAAIIDAQQEHGWDQITVYIAARLVDYTTNESGLNVVEGNPFEPVPLHERWVFLRPSGPCPWRVSAIR